MYEEFFGMQEKPFSLTPDTNYFFCHTGQREALNVLMVALESGEGFVKITGEVGTGKTLLCRELLNRLGDEYYTVYIPNPYLSPTNLRMVLAQELGMSVGGLSDHDNLLGLINERLIEINDQGKRVVICLDEAQAMPDRTLEALRLLTNLETEKYKLIQVVLFGQPELNENLAKVQNRQLRQRIIYSFELQPLDKSRIVTYINHRLRVAGYNGEGLFHPKAIDQLYQATHGVPRLINVLCNKALLVAFGKGEQNIQYSHMDDAVKDTEGVVIFPSLREYFLNISIGIGFLLLVIGLWFI